MISILSKIINKETSSAGVEKKFVIDSLPVPVIEALTGHYNEATGLPWLILDKNSKTKFDPLKNFSNVLRYVEDDVTAFRTFYTGKIGFLLFAPPGVNFQGSLDTTMNLVADLFTKVRDEIFDEASVSKEEKALLVRCIDIYLQQTFEPNRDKAEITWQLLGNVYSELIYSKNGVEGALSVLGFPCDTTLKNLKISTSLIADLSNLVYGEGLINAFQMLKSKAGKEDLEYVLAPLDELQNNIYEKVPDAVSFSYTPYAGISNPYSDWWKMLTLDVWEQLLRDENRDENYQVELVSDNYLELNSKQIIVLGGDVQLKTKPNHEVSWKVNNSEIGKVSSNLTVREDLLDNRVVYQTVLTTSSAKKRKSIKFLHFDSSLLPIAVDCDTANSVSAFKQTKSPAEFLGSITFNSIGTHVLTIYYNLDWRLGGELHGRDVSSDQEEDVAQIVIGTPCRKDGQQVGCAKVEIFADENCTYTFEVVSPAGHTYSVSLDVFSGDGEVVDATSFYESLIVENLSRKNLGAKPRVVVPGGIFSLEKFLVKNKAISFNPIAVGPDLETVLYQVEDVFDPNRCTLLSSYLLDKSFDNRPTNLHEEKAFKDLILIRSELIDILFSTNDEGSLTSFIENINLAKVFPSNSSEGKLLDKYFEEYESLLRNPDTAGKLLWFDTIVLYWNKAGSKT